MEQNLSIFSRRMPAKALIVAVVFLSLTGSRLDAQVRLDLLQAASTVNAYSFSEVQNPIASPNCDPPENISDNGIHFIPVWAGTKLWAGAHSLIKRGLPHCKVSASGTGNVTVEGDGTSSVKVRWWCHSIGQYDCYDPDCPWMAQDTSRLNASVRMLVSGANPGDTVTVSYYWVHFSSIASESEGAGEDTAGVGNAYLNLFGQTGFGAGMNLSGNIKFAQKKTGDTTLSFVVQNEDTLTIDVSGMTLARIFPPAAIPPVEREDDASADFFGYVIIVVNAPGSPVAVLPPQYCPGAETFFSVDIGGDTEISDPLPDGNEFLDPGDLYERQATMPIPFFNDSLIFGSDPAPFTGTPAGTCLPGPLQALQRYLNFDLDGSDRIDYDFNGNAGSYGPGQPSISPFASNCIYRADFLLLSYDEDRGIHFSSAVNCNVPSVFAPEDSLMLRGSVTGGDEVLLAMISNVSVMPPWLGSIAPCMDEQTFSPLLMPSPLSPYPPDPNDDVDALDICHDVSVCDYQYFSVDHEAHYIYGTDTLLPGGIYQLTAPGIIKAVIRPSLHLGLSDETDIDAFEFTWIYDSAQQRNGLALVFSVSVNDPFDTPDYTGGLDPGTLYASFLDGAFFEFLPPLMPGNIDAIAFSCGLHPVFGSVIVPPVYYSGVNENVIMASGFSVYPNPANGDFTMEFELQTAARIGVVVRDMSGRTVWELPEEPFAAGLNRILCSLPQNSSGIFFAEIVLTNGSQISRWQKKLVVVR